MNLTETKQFSLYRGLMMIAALVVIVAGMMEAKSILIPLMLAVFVTVICNGPICWLENKGCPRGLALAGVLLGLCISVALVGVVVGSSVNDFVQKLPEYETKLQQQTQQLQTFLADQGVEISGDGIQEMLNPGAVMKYAGVLLSEMSGLLANGFLILLLVIFLSLEAKGLPAKFRAAYGAYDKTVEQFGAFHESIKHYMSIKTTVSLVTGVLVAFSLWMIGLDYPFMWGLLAFAFNFIPNIGSILAAIPAVLLAIIQLGLGSGAIVAICYVAINVVIGSIIEPRFMGKRLGLSPTIVFCSLLFWGWVFGPVGMLLSVVLTILLKLMLESSESTKHIAFLLGPNPEDEIKHAKPETENSKAT